MYSGVVIASFLVVQVFGVPVQNTNARAAAATGQSPVDNPLRTVNCVGCAAAGLVHNGLPSADASTISPSENSHAPSRVHDGLPSSRGDSKESSSSPAYPGNNQGSRTGLQTGQSPVDNPLHTVNCVGCAAAGLVHNGLPSADASTISPSENSHAPSRVHNGLPSSRGDNKESSSSPSTSSTAYPGRNRGSLIPTGSHSGPSNNLIPSGVHSVPANNLSPSHNVAGLIPNNEESSGSPSTAYPNSNEGASSTGTESPVHIPSSGLVGDGAHVGSSTRRPGGSSNGSSGNGSSGSSEGGRAKNHGNGNGQRGGNGNHFGWGRGRGN